LLLRLGLAASLALALLLASSTASAVPDVLRPGTRPMWFSGGLGPTFFGLAHAGGSRWSGHRDWYHNRFKLALDFGYHFSGDFEGPAIGACIEQGFDDYWYLFNPGFKFWWDIMPKDDLGLYIAPFGKAGFALGTVYGHDADAFAFNLAVGAEGRLILGDRGMVFVRPIQLDTFLGDFYGTTFIMSYDILVGGGVTF